MSGTPQEFLQLAGLMQARDWRAAQALCRVIRERHPQFLPAWIAGGQIAQALGSQSTALEHFDHALELAPTDARAQMLRAQSLLALGRREQAFAAAAAATCAAPQDAAIWDAAGSLYSFGNEHRLAIEAYDTALSCTPRNAPILYNRASVRRFVGDLEGAESDYDAVIALKPDDFEAYKNRSELRTQSATRNHVGELEALLRRPFADWRGEVQLGFALAKEYEDLGEYAKSIDRLMLAARKRRQHMRYDIAQDIDTVQWIMDAFPQAPAVPVPQASEESPIFIVGLPRSGSTLVERIISSHSEVAAAGELDCFALSLVDAARAAGARPGSRQSLVERSATLEFSALGRAYLHRARVVSGVPGRFIDKMPLNYLYCGLIARALPQARIVHVKRHPMAVCYAMYKTLFKDGYPFSYDLSEIARYYLGYRRLMDHWQASMPGVICEVEYEALIADQRAETARLLAFCGLEWQEACVQFHRNAAASTTASAVQIRRPIYDSSVGQWRNYAQELDGLRLQLTAAGIKI